MADWRQQRLNSEEGKKGFLGSTTDTKRGGNSVTNSESTKYLIAVGTSPYCSSSFFPHKSSFNEESSSVRSLPAFCCLQHFRSFNQPNHSSPTVKMAFSKSLLVSVAALPLLSAAADLPLVGKRSNLLETRATCEPGYVPACPGELRRVSQPAGI